VIKISSYVLNENIGKVMAILVLSCCIASASSLEYQVRKDKGTACTTEILVRYQLMSGVASYCMGQAIPNEIKNFSSTGPETRRKRSVCSRASKFDIERVPY
jgi:hypothetical protein